jgi:S1-C subfamily serine protease
VTSPPQLNSNRSVDVCPACGEQVRRGSTFCGRCGEPAAVDVASGLRPAVAKASSNRRRALAVALGLLAAAALAVALFALIQAGREQTSRKQAVGTLNRALESQSERLKALEAQNEVLGKRLSSTQKSLTLSKAGVAPLARRILRSVFTVDTPDGLGTGWAAWTVAGDTYLVTANHVAADAIDNGTRHVTVKQKARSWPGTIVKTDPVNDLATIRVHGAIAPPLWQTPDSGLIPLAGDQLLLVGSPYGLEGTVTTGVVSRVAYDEIQTDAAANPGNSGGPGVDQRGRIVGVLLSGGGENLNFLVPIQRACVTVRAC